MNSIYNKTDLLNYKRVEIGKKVYDSLYLNLERLFKQDVNIFLIGASVKNKDSLRRRIQDSLSDEKINIYFPEHIFEEILSQNDLLTLENLLAESVDAIVMCIESPGSFTELGAFCNHIILRDKLIVYLDKKYERHNSFIKVGPIKLLKSRKKSRVIWKNMNTFTYEEKIFLKNSIREIKKYNSETIKTSVSNPIFTERFLLSLLYVIDNCSRKNIIEIIKAVSSDDKAEREKNITIVDSSLNMLLRRREIRLVGNVYKITKIGHEKLIKDFGVNFIIYSLDKFRLDMIKFELRKYWKNSVAT
ncbi:retron St85 family effector protein [Paenibacillus sp. FSL M7-0134]|uniref:retron St85 family effector protein n=1 Tax=Paenibacillus sp. FSL M7-0134 TaxID=2954754 RepID=UPI0030FBDC0C